MSVPMKRNESLLEEEISKLISDESSDSDFAISDLESSASEEEVCEDKTEPSSSESDTSESCWVERNPSGQYTPQIQHQFVEFPGLKHAPPSDSKPIVYFHLFFTEVLLKLMVTETNRYAQQYLQTHKNVSPNSRVSSWQPTTLSEMKAFVACILNMGVITKPTMYSYWSKKKSLSTPWFRHMFSRNRFQLLLRFFHLVDNSKISSPDDPFYDPCVKFQPIVDHANRIFRHYYTPHQQLRIDQSLVGTKSHSHHRWGIKFWMICDAISNYCLVFYAYLGAKNNTDKDSVKKYGLAYTVVTKLLTIGNYANKGYHIFCDNFFSSIPLARYLYTVGTYITGSLHRNRRFLPHQILQKFNVGEVKFFRNAFTLLCGFREKKSRKNPVLFLSTSSAPTLSNIESKKNKTPDIILEYNRYMGGINTSDMMLFVYLDERRTLKYWKKMVFNVLSRMLLNAYILYKENLLGGNKPLPRLNFNTSIIEELAREWHEVRDIYNKSNEEENPPGPSQIYGVKMLPGRKLRLCNECSTPVRKIRSRTVCVRCDKGLHTRCVNNHKC